MNPLKVAVVGCFGRGQWLATSLAKQGYEVTFLDVSDRMGSWIPEDLEGPFGVFLSERLAGSQVERLSQDEGLVSAEQGFVIWLESGPLELKGPLTRYRLEKLGVPSELYEKLQSNDRRLSAHGISHLQNKTFKESWLLAFAHLWGSADFFPNMNPYSENGYLPLFANFSVRFPSRQGFHKSVDWCRRHGVNVLERADVVDVSFKTSKSLKGLEYRTEGSERTTVLEADWFVWALNGEETGMLGSKIQSLVYQKQILEPDWAWVRYRAKLSPSSQRDQLPNHSVWIQKLELPWSHENFVVIQRTASMEIFDCWMMIPNLQRFSRDYLSQKGEKLIQLLGQRLPLSKAVLAEYPSGFDSTYNHAGPTRQPVYRAGARASYSLPYWQNLKFHNSESWLNLTWDGIFEMETKLNREFDMIMRRHIEKTREKNKDKELEKDS